MDLPERRIVPADVAVVHAYCAVVLEEIVEGGRAAKIIIFNTQFLVFDTKFLGFNTNFLVFNA